MRSYLQFFIPITLTKAKVVYNFGLFECNRVKNKRAKVALNRSPEQPVKQELFQIISLMLALKMIRAM